VLGISLASLYRKLGADADGAASSEQGCAPAD
jgi:hypothetical protein